MSPVVEPHNSTSTLQQIPVAGWALGGVERRLVLMEIVDLTEYPLGDGQGLAAPTGVEHGEGIHWLFSCRRVPLDMVPTRWDMHSGHAPDDARRLLKVASKRR